MTTPTRNAPRNGSVRLLLVLCVLVSLAAAKPLVAQSTFATVQGTVLDASGAAVPNATIVVTNEQTGSTETMQASASGEYRLFDLEAGNYTIAFRGSGFGDRTFAHQVLLARQVLRLDARLDAGSVATTVDVDAAGGGFSDVATVSQSLTSKDIDTLALNFRASDSTSPLYVATLTPGVESDSSGNISVAGGLAYFTSYSIDGISTVSVRNNGPNVNLFPSVEAISEFKVNSANNDAEFGQPSDITVTTKAGTNQYHGGLYEFYQSSSFNAVDPVTHTQGHLTANDFGAYLGGPLSIPHLYNAKDKAFFFIDYEGTRRPESDNITITVPTNAFLGGDFSALCTTFNAAGICTTGTQLYNPLTAQPFLKNQLPVNPSSVSLLKALYPRTASTAIGNNYSTILPGSYTLNNIDARLDYAITSRHKLWARFGGKDVLRTGSDGTTSYDPTNGTFSNANKLRNTVVDYSYTITSHLVNEARGGYSLSNFDTAYPLAAQGSAILTAAGVTGLPTAPASGGVPDFLFTDGSATETNVDYRPRTQKNLTWDIADIATYVLGKHAIKGGVSYEHLNFRDYLTFTPGDQYGDYAFVGLTGYGIADAVLGVPGQTDYAIDGPDVLPFTHTWGFFLQDSWKIVPNLTVDYGLRYEIHAPFDDATHQLANFQPNIPGGRVVVQGQAGLNQVLPVFASSIGSTQIVTNQQAGLPTTLRHTYYGDIDPRLGFSWQPFPTAKLNTVLHAGVGAYTVPVLGSVLYSLAGVASSNYLVFHQLGNLIFPNVFPSGAGGSAGTPDFRRANQINLKDPREVQWNAQLEQGIGFGAILRLGYTGSHTTQLIESPDLNQVVPNTLGYTAYVAKNGLLYPNFNAVLSRTNGPSAKYDALTAEVQRRYLKGITLDANYTWAHDTSNALGAVPTAQTTENGATILNMYNIHADYGNVLYESRNRFVGTFLYDLPYGRGQRYGAKLNPAANLALGGWSIAGVELWHSGPFLTPSFSGTDPSGTGVLTRGVTTAQRPDCTGLPTAAAHQNRSGWFNINAFSVPANNIGRFGNCPVGTLIGPGTQTFGGTVGKNFPVNDRINVRYEAQFSNLFNHTNLGIPATNISSPSTFGVVTDVQDANSSYGPSAGPRNLQMSLRLTF